MNGVGRAGAVIVSYPPVVVSESAPIEDPANAARLSSAISVAQQVSERGPDAMTLAGAPGDTADQSPSWVEWCLLIALLAMGLLDRCTVLPVFGEEPRRGQIAREMLASGDYLVPRVQGLPRLSRPPLQNWLIALASRASGSVDLWAIRLPSLIASALTVWLIYGFVARTINRQIAWLAVLIYSSNYLVLGYWRLGETEALFTLFVTASLLLWEWGRRAGWPAAFTGTVCGVCAGLGTLTKGLQAPVYFFGAVCLWQIYDVWSRQRTVGQTQTGSFRELIVRMIAVLQTAWSVSQQRRVAASVISFLVVVGIWQVPFLFAQGAHDAWWIYWFNMSTRFEGVTKGRLIEQWLALPLEVLLASLAPWSLALVGLVSREVRQRVWEYRALVIPLLIAVGWASVFVWWLPGGRARYLMPVFPLLSIVLAIVCQADFDSGWQRVRSRWWTIGRRVIGYGMIAAAMLAVVVEVLRGVTGLSLLESTSHGREAILMGLAGGGLLWVASNRSTALRWSAWCVAAFAIGVAVGPGTTLTAHRCVDVGSQIAELKQQLPGDAQLVSLSQLHHCFLYHYASPIPIHHGSEAEIPDDVFFAVHIAGGDPLPDLPFAWRLEREICVDRLRQKRPQERVLIGRRVTQLAHDDDSP